MEPAWIVIGPLVAVASVVGVLWGFTTAWSELDWRVYMNAGMDVRAGVNPYDRELYAGFLYSPPMAGLFALANHAPALSLAVWRFVSLAAMVFVLRGLGPVPALILATPFVWFDLIVGNVGTFAAAAMVAVVRWPSVRTVALYAVLVALIPKPQFLPVIAWGAWHVPAARFPVLAIGLAGLGMLAFPGYLDRLTSQPHVGGGHLFTLPEPWAKIAAGFLTIAALRWHRLLALATIAAAPYWWLYNLTPVVLAGISTSRSATPTAGRR